MAQPAPSIDTGTLEGRVVAGRYRLTDVLGRGGFGAVYTGHDSASGEAVAVKVFSREEGLAPRADREARTARKLDHPNIHEVVGVAHDEDHAYLISQLVVGERFDRSALTDEQAVRAIAAVCDALAHAHERGVVHRDVKPANILVSTDGTVHLTDFGIARDEDAREPTVDERLLGTLSYMAPEQASGERATGATDVWSAGLTLYATLTGRNPYRAHSLAELLENQGQRRARAAPGAPRAAPRPLARARARHAPRSRPPPGRRRPARPAADGDRRAGRRRGARLRARGGAGAPARPRPARSAARPAAARDIGARHGLGGRVDADRLPDVPAVVDAPDRGRARRRSPGAGRAPPPPAAAVIAVPAFWNFAEAAGLAWIALAAAWAWTTGHTTAGRRRCLVPLSAVPLALVGLGPAFVLVAATAPTRARRAAEAGAGAIVAAVCGGWAGAGLDPALAGANSPLAYVHVLARDPAHGRDRSGDGACSPCCSRSPGGRSGGCRR